MLNESTKYLLHIAFITAKKLNSLFFNKVRPQLAILFRRSCFPVNLEKFLRTPFFTEHLRWLLLTTEINTIASIKQRNYCVYLLRKNEEDYYINSYKKDILDKRQF